MTDDESLGATSGPESSSLSSPMPSPSPLTSSLTSSPSAFSSTSSTSSASSASSASSSSFSSFSFSKFSIMSGLPPPLPPPPPPPPQAARPMTTMPQSKTTSKRCANRRKMFGVFTRAPDCFRRVLCSAKSPASLNLMLRLRTQKIAHPSTGGNRGLRHHCRIIPAVVAPPPFRLGRWKKRPERFFASEASPKDEYQDDTSKKTPGAFFREQREPKGRVSG
ncbi:MAG: hypothetical protein ACR2P7_10240 [bacterium]